MTKSITPKQIKSNNRQLIYDYIYENDKVSQQDISYSLRLSRPTVTANLNELENEGFIFKNGQIESDLIGRKAAAYSIVPDYRIGIGVEITQDVVKVMAIDLYGKKIKREVLDYAYSTEDEYAKETSNYINDFIDSLGVGKERILGIGFAIQGLVSPDGRKILYGKILKNSGITISSFQQYLDYPCSFIHDSESAAICELWEAPGLDHVFFINLSYHLGAVPIFNRKIHSGLHGHSGTIEHISHKEDGDLCYCGKRGCLETILSMNALLKGRDPDEFFALARRKDTPEAVTWKEYLHRLASTINSLHLVYDSQFLLSGYLVAYMKESDIHYIYSEIAKITPFEEASDFILLSKLPKHSITIGAALPYISRFLKNISE